MYLHKNLKIYALFITYHNGFYNFMFLLYNIYLLVKSKLFYSLALISRQSRLLYFTFILVSRYNKSIYIILQLIFHSLNNN